MLTTVESFIAASANVDYTLIRNQLKKLMKLERVLRKRTWKKRFVQDKCCVACGETENLTIDHIVPRAKGGPNKYENYMILCRPCNNNKKDKDPYEWLSEQHNCPDIQSLKNMIDAAVEFCYKNY